MRFLHFEGSAAKCQQVLDIQGETFFLGLVPSSIHLDHTPYPRSTPHGNVRQGIGTYSYEEYKELKELDIVVFSTPYDLRSFNSFMAGARSFKVVEKARQKAV
jgi:hypothetical protein